MAVKREVDGRLWRVGFALAGLTVLCPSINAAAQTFYQLTNPRIYRVDPPTNNPWDHGYGFGGLAFRSIPGDPNGTVLISWERDILALAQGKRGDLAEVVIDFASSPNPQGTNDATLVSQVFDWGWCYDMDYESDDRVLVRSRYEYIGSPRSPGNGLGRFLRDGDRISEFQMLTPFPGARTGNNQERTWTAFSGRREIAGTTYDTAAFIQGGTVTETATCAIFLLNLETGELLDADPGTPHGSNMDGNPWVGFFGPTGVTNIASPIQAGTYIQGFDIVGDIGFIVANMNAFQENGYLAVMQVDLVTKRVLAMANISQMLNPKRAGHALHYSFGFDVSAAGDGRIRMLIADSTDSTLTSLSVIDGVAVPEGTDPVDPGAIYVPPSDGGTGDGGTPDQPANGGGTTNGDQIAGSAVIWVCPGIGIALPTMLCFVGIRLSRRRIGESLN